MLSKVSKHLHPWARSVLSSALAALSMAVALPAAAQFVPNETRVSPNPGLIDYEISQSRARYTWTDQNGVLWIGNMNRSTGDFEPKSGQGKQIATNTVAGWNMFMWNGPEWLSMTGGDQIFFSYYLPNKKKVAANVRMALAVLDPAGTWVVQPLDTGGQARMSHIASKNRGDTRPHIKYLDPAENQYWRDVLVAGSEEKLDFVPPSNKSWRFASGQRSFLYTNEVAGVPQVFRYLLDDKTHQQLTFDDGAKDTGRTVPWMWKAPEFGGNFVLSTVVNGNELRVYRQFGGSGNFTPVYSASLPAGRVAGSPEWFTYNGKSYVFMVAYVDGAEYASEVWISSIDPSKPLLRRINDDTLLRARNDPEVFITTGKGPLIYYNRYDPSINPEHPLCAACSEGVYRADPGLLGL